MNKRPHHFRLERIEAGRVVSRGFACGVGCLMAVVATERDSGERVVYESRGRMTPVAEVVVEPGVEEQYAR